MSITRRRQVEHPGGRGPCTVSNLLKEEENGGRYVYFPTGRGSSRGIDAVRSCLHPTAGLSRTQRRERSWERCALRARASRAHHRSRALHPRTFDPLRAGHADPKARLRRGVHGESPHRTPASGSGPDGRRDGWRAPSLRSRRSSGRRPTEGGRAIALQPFLDQDVPGPKRDYVGCGRHIPKVRWPDSARVAVNLVLNYEEGSEYTHAVGGGQNDRLTEIPWGIEPSYRDLAAGPVYEYGSRAGVWRVQRLVDGLGLPITVGRATSDRTSLR